MTFLDIITSGYAIAVYAIVLIAIIALIVVFTMLGESRRSGGAEPRDKDAQRQTDPVVNAVRSVPDMAVSDEVKVGKGVSRFGALTDIDRQRSKYEKTDRKSVV